MDREHSAERLSSRGGSERESSYVMESGFYVTSFAATILIASLVAFGVLLVTLLIALSVMLHSCQSRSAGVVETPISAYDCRAFADLNRLEGSQLPGICREFAARYISQGQYALDLNSAVWLLEDHLRSVHPRDDGFDVFLLDVDDLLPPNPHKPGCGDCAGAAGYLKHDVIVRIYAKLHSSGWRVVLFSRELERERNRVREKLHSAGLGEESLLIMRSTDTDDLELLLSRRRDAQGFRIAGTISSHLDALTGSGGLGFKLPNPICYNFESQSQSCAGK